MNIIVPLVKLREIVRICDDSPRAVTREKGNVVVNVTHSDRNEGDLGMISAKARAAIRALEAGTE